MPTPETESDFLKNYTPQSVIKPFECRLPSMSWRENGDTAGRRFVAHKAGFKWLFAMRSKKWMPLMNALSDDVSAQLLHNGAQILSSSGDALRGFHFDYKLGKSIGTVTISPLVITPPTQIHRGMPLPEGVVDTTADVELAEKWFPNEPGTTQVRVNDSTMK